MKVLYKRINEEKARVIEYSIDDSVTFEGDTLIVSTIPLPDNIEGKTPILYVNPTNSTFWYEYEDRTLTPEEELKQLKERQKLIQQALDDLLLGGM
jgi:hypothetical protein